MSGVAFGTGAASGFPFALVDRVLEVEPGTRAVGTKLVSANEPCFLGHFPGVPVMPGVLVCEALAQLAGELSDDEVPLRLMAVEKARFRRPVLPGDALRLEVECVTAGPPRRLRGVATVGEAVVAEVELTADRPQGPAIHPTASVARGAELADGVVVSAHAVIGSQVRIGRDTWIGPHAVVTGRSTIGARNRIFQFASVGAAPQDLKFRGEPSRLEMGSDNIVREFVSLNPGTSGGGMLTSVGNGCLFMVNSHLGHDGRLGNNVIVAPGAALGGHVAIDDFAIIGGLVGVHQFVRIGESALCAAGAMVSMDVPPFCVVAGDRARLHGLNVVGMRRRGFAPDRITSLKRAYRGLFQSHLGRRQAVAQTEDAHGRVPEVQKLLAFLAASERGVCRT